MRVTATILNTATNQTITRPGYLIEIDLSPLIRLSSVGDVSYQGHHFSGLVGLEVSGIGQNGTGMGAGTVVITDMTDTFQTLFLSQRITSVPVRIWATDAGAAVGGSIAADAAVLVFSGSIGGIEIIESSGQITLELISHQAGILYAPRRTIGQETGFTRLMPAGTEIKFGNETYRLERR